MLGIRENLSPDFIVYQNEKARLVEAIERLKTAPTPRLFWSGSRIITDGDLNVLQSVPDRIAGGGHQPLAPRACYAHVAGQRKAPGACHAQCVKSPISFNHERGSAAIFS